ncbi:MAG TPA: HAD family hydrolase [Propionibacteriaceae bacterium]|nr:HAD family hydrolase [Propionibacteriaceae bacterium]
MTAPASEARRTAARIPKLIVSDLDGTFLLPDGTVSELNSAAVLEAQAAGIPVLFATGRPVRWLDVIRELPGAHPTVISSNGAILYDLGVGKVVDQVFIDPLVALDAVAALRKILPGASFAFESGARFGYEPTYRAEPVDIDTNHWIFTGPAEQLAHTEQFVKMLVQHAEVGADELLEHVKSVVGDTLTVTHAATGDYGLVEISGPGVSKASMLRRCCERLGIDAADVAAFGDMPNDLDMLSWVGMPHVVANAHPLLLDLGVPVVPGNAESGVGQTIRSWLP